VGAQHEEAARFSKGSAYERGARSPASGHIATNAATMWRRVRAGRPGSRAAAGRGGAAPAEQLELEKRGARGRGNGPLPPLPIWTVRS